MPSGSLWDMALHEKLHRNSKQDTAAHQAVLPVASTFDRLLALFAYASMIHVDNSATPRDPRQGWLPLMTTVPVYPKSMVS